MNLDIFAQLNLGASSPIGGISRGHMFMHMAVNSICPIMIYFSIHIIFSCM